MIAFTYFEANPITNTNSTISIAINKLDNFNNNTNTSTNTNTNTHTHNSQYNNTQNLARNPGGSGFDSCFKRPATIEEEENEEEGVDSSMAIIPLIHPIQLIIVCMISVISCILVPC